MQIKKVILLLLVLALLPVPAALARGDAPPQTQTIMVYMVGSDLEPKWFLGTRDILEMMEARPDPERINLLVMTGGTSYWHNHTIPTDKLSIFHVTSAGPKLVHSLDLASMGEADTLLSFLNYGAEAYPADSYGLIFWDHGGGPMIGIGVDLLYDSDALTLMELESAFSRSAFQGENQLEFIVFDACLMGSMEVASVLAPYTRYMLASEEVLPGAGIDYHFLSDYSKSDLSGLSAGNIIIDYTSRFYADLAQRYPQRQDLVTLSLLDLDRIDGVHTAVDALFSDLSKGLEVTVYSDIARRRDGTKSYGRTAATYNWDMIDLHDLAHNMSTLYPEQAQQVQEAIDHLVVENYANVPRTQGLSIYFPLLNKRMLSSEWAQMYQEFDFTPAYRSFLSHFGSILLSDSLGQWTGSETPVVSFDEQTGDYFIQLTPEQAQHYERAEYYVLQRLTGDEYMLTHMSSDVTLDAQNRVFANFDGRVLAIYESGKTRPIVPYLQEKESVDGVASYQIPSLLSRRGENAGQEMISAELLAEINREAGTARITGAIRKEEESQLGKKDVPLYEWDSIYLPYTSFYLTRGADGALLPVGDWVLSDNLRTASLPADQRIDVRLEPLQGEQSDYFVIISIVDTQGFVYSSELMPLTSATPEEAPEEGAQDQTGLTEAAFALYSAPLPLFEDDYLDITLDTIDLSGQQTEPRRSPDTVHVRLTLKNLSQETLNVNLDWASVNGFVMDAVSAVTLSAGGTDTLVIDLPIVPREDQTSMLEAGIKLVQNLGFQLTWLPSDLLNPEALGSQAFDVITVFAVGAGHELTEPEPEDIQTLLDEHGFTVEQYGKPGMRGGFFHIPLRIINKSSGFDIIELELAALNGIAISAFASLHVPPGMTRYTHFTIDSLPIILEEEFSEFQYLYDGIDNLQTLGITEVGEIWLRFALDRASLIGRAGQRSLRQALSPITITLDEGVEQPLDSEGTVLFEGEGIKLVRLASDPEGQRLYIRNDSGRTLRLSTYDITRVDGVLYSENIAVQRLIGPHQSTYTKLFSYLPGIYPEGEEIETRFILIDLDDNTLQLRSEPITFPLKP